MHALSINISVTQACQKLVILKAAKAIPVLYLAGCILGHWSHSFTVLPSDIDGFVSHQLGFKFTLLEARACMPADCCGCNS